MRINNNIMAINTHRQYGINNAAIAKNTEKLSSGYRINRAGDDAAGLAISEKMRAQIRGLNMASKNSQDAVSLVQTAEGALQETHNILQRMRELAVQAASDTNDNSVDRAALDAEYQQLKKEVDDTAQKTKFNGMGVIDGSFARETVDPINDTQAPRQKISFTLGSGAQASDTDSLSIAYNATTGIASLLQGTTEIATAFVPDRTYEAGERVNMQFSDGSVLRFLTDIPLGSQNVIGGAVAGVTLSPSAGIVGEGMTIQTGANQGDELNITICAMDATILGLTDAKVSDRESASNAITWTNDAINQVSTQRAQLGALQNRLNHKIANLDTSAENLQAAESRIRDVDMAKEMTEFTKNNILSQASTAMLAQANAAPQGVLSLLQ